MRKTINSGVRLSMTQFAKWEDLSASLGMPRNAVIGMLIEQARVISQPSVVVNLENKNGASASVSQDGSAGTICTQ